MPAQVDTVKCEGCGDCVEACPSSAIVMVENSAKKADIKKDECIDCGACVDACPHQAIAMMD